MGTQKKKKKGKKYIFFAGKPADTREKTGQCDGLSKFGNVRTCRRATRATRVRETMSYAKAARGVGSRGAGRYLGRKGPQAGGRRGAGVLRRSNTYDEMFASETDHGAYLAMVRDFEKVTW